MQRYPHTALLYLRNGLTDCVQIWYVGWGSLTKCLPQVISGVHLHVRTCASLSHTCSACRHSVTVRPIALKFGMHMETHSLQLMQQSRVGYLCTCARADRASVSQERFDRLCSNLVCGLGVTKYIRAFHKSWVGWVISARAHVTPPPIFVSQDPINPRPDRGGWCTPPEVFRR